jgi:hypothetical protein
MVIFPDLTELCGAFADARVEYLLVGGYAVALGSTDAHGLGASLGRPRLH